MTDRSAFPGAAAAGEASAWARRQRRGSGSTLAAGEPAVWLTGGALVICTLMVIGLLAWVLRQGLVTFWPQPVVHLETLDQRVYMGEITRADAYAPSEAVIGALPAAQATRARADLAADGEVVRRLVRTGNFRLTQNHFVWVDDFAVGERRAPPWALVLERLEWGRFYGFPVRFLLAAEEPDAPPVEVAEGAEAAWAAFAKHHAAVRERWQRRRALEEDDTGKVNHRQEKARLALRAAELGRQKALAEDAAGARAQRAQAAFEAAEEHYQEVRAWADQAFADIRAEIDRINRENGRYRLVMRTAGEGASPPQETEIRLDEIVRAYPANQLSPAGKLGVYLSRWWEFLSGEPREANSEGGVFPAIFGTVAMTLIMSLAVVPLGVLAALYLREYAKGGALVSAVRIAVNNLAGVPSIVFGVFGLGFFCYVVGASLDQVLFAARLPNPTFGKGGLLWASLTLALLTLPVVIVATEEALAAVPVSMREGSYACGASKWQTIRRIVLPRAMPGIITGMVLAIARGAGEVAPLMLVGAVKLAPELPVDGTFPYLHPERSFMHLGFHIFDVGFQSQNSEAAKPMVYTTTLLLITIIALLNMLAIWLRSRLRQKFATDPF